MAEIVKQFLDPSVFCWTRPFPPPSSFFFFFTNLIPIFEIDCCRQYWKSITLPILPKISFQFHWRLFHMLRKGLKCLCPANDGNCKKMLLVFFLLSDRFFAGHSSTRDNSTYKFMAGVHQTFFYEKKPSGSVNHLQLDRRWMAFRNGSTVCFKNFLGVVYSTVMWVS